jgi:putative iron-regulated protein
MHALLLTLALFLAAHATAVRAQSPEPAAVVRHYAALVHANYADTLASALDLQQAVKAFVAQPGADGFDQARKAWLAAREWYGQTEAFRFYAGPIDDDNGPEGRLNAWPLDESYVDYVQGRRDAGIISDRKAPITKRNLARLNERGGEENVATGWHAIEFLLWGQDFDDAGPGKRSFEDYVDGKGQSADRRRQYLIVVTELLIDDLRYLVKAWAPGAANYRARFERGGQESLRKILVGVGSLARMELAGERMEVALNARDQEEEHSCFSDNTHRDIVSNALGIENVWLGRYVRRDSSVLAGPSLRDLVASRDAALAQRTTRQIAEALAAASSIQPPFDREIAGGPGAPGTLRVQNTIDSLVRQSKDLIDAASAIGITRLTLASPE